MIVSIVCLWKVRVGLYAVIDGNIKSSKLFLFLFQFFSFERFFCCNWWKKNKRSLISCTFIWFENSVAWLTDENVNISIPTYLQVAEKGEGDSKETEAENKDADTSKEEKKKDSKATNLRKKLSFKKSFSFLRKKAAKEKKEEEAKKEGEEEKKEEAAEEKAADTTAEAEKTEAAGEEKAEKKEEEEAAPAPPTEAPPGNLLAFISPHYFPSLFPPLSLPLFLFFLSPSLLFNINTGAQSTFFC